LDRGFKDMRGELSRRRTKGLGELLVIKVVPRGRALGRHDVKRRVDGTHQITVNFERNRPKKEDKQGGGEGEVSIARCALRAARWALGAGCSLALDLLPIDAGRPGDRA
jgi:hypothetical protein